MSLYLPFCRGLIHGYILKCLIIGELLFSNISFTDSFSSSPFSLFSRCGYYHGGGCVSHRGVINAPKEYCPSAFMRWLKVAVLAMEVDFRSSWRVFPPPSLWVHGGFWHEDGCVSHGVWLLLTYEWCPSNLLGHILIIYFFFVFSSSSSSSSSMDTFSSLVWIDR